MYVVWGSLGSIMWVDGYWGAASRHVDSHGVFSHGIRVVPAIESQSESKKPVESILHSSRASFTRKHGLKIKTDKNTNLLKKMGRKEIRWGWFVFCNVFIKERVCKFLRPFKEGDYCWAVDTEKRREEEKEEEEKMLRKGLVLQKERKKQRKKKKENSWFFHL